MTSASLRLRLGRVSPEPKSLILRAIIVTQDLGREDVSAIANCFDELRGLRVFLKFATKPHHLDDAVTALDVQLDAKTVAALEKPYKPRAVMGHS